MHGVDHQFTIKNLIVLQMEWGFRTHLKSNQITALDIPKGHLPMTVFFFFLFFLAVWITAQNIFFQQIAILGTICIDFVDRTLIVFNRSLTIISPLLMKHVCPLVLNYMNNWLIFQVYYHHYFKCICYSFILFFSYLSAVCMFVFACHWQTRFLFCFTSS